LFGKNKPDEPQQFFSPPPGASDFGAGVIDGEIRKSQVLDNILTPASMDEAWMKYVIEFHYSFNLPESQAMEIISMMKPLIDLGPKSNIRRREVTQYLYGFDLVWENYLMYVKKGKYDGTLLTLKELLRNAYELQLNRSIDGWLGRLMHTKLFRIFTSDDNQGRVQKGMRFLGRGGKGQGPGQSGA